MVSVVLTGCAGSGWGGGGGGVGADSINVLMVNNPQMIDLQRLTAENFTAETGITVNFTVLPENDVRDKISQEFSSQAGQYDVASLSNFEIPIYAKSKWIAPLDDYVAADTAFDQDDILPPMTAVADRDDGKLYGEPFYGESSFLMYRKDVLDAKGITMPAEADLAAGRPDRRPGRRQAAGHGGDLPARPARLGPDVRPAHHGGQHLRRHLVREDWTPKVNAPEFTTATQFYVDLVRAHGEVGAPQAGFTECLNNMVQGNAAMWYDATSAAGLAGGRRLAGARARSATSPRRSSETDELRLAVRLVVEHPAGQHEEGQRLEVHLLGVQQGVRGAGRPQLGWSSVPAGKRASTYENPQYLQVASAFAEPTEAAI